MLLCSKISTILLSIPVYYILAVLFGAPLLSNFEDTVVFSLVLSALTVVPLLFVLESDDESLIDFLLHFKWIARRRCHTSGLGQVVAEVAFALHIWHSFWSGTGLRVRLLFSVYQAVEQFF
ncbi:GPI biosynthesis protein family pig-F domain-containing protein [Ditylenchus destructor]|nr:GPI biosynthesis protein family pig-F domain-containing protein [Ditylenchus destructor]